jgi:hypothetical protein
MRTLLLAAVMLIAGVAGGFAGDEIFTATKDCSAIGHDGTGYVLYTDRFHNAEYIPDNLVIRVDASTIEYRGTAYKLLNDEIIAKCG